MSLATLSVNIIAKLAKFEEGLNKAGRLAEKRAHQIERAFDNIGKMLTLGMAGLSYGLVMRKFVDETVNAQREQAQLAAVLQSTGMAAGYSREQLNAMATELSQSSVFSEGDINKAQARLLSYTGIVGKEFPAAMQMVVDMADRMGMSLEQSAETVGRALDIPSQGMQSLTRQGFRFSDEQKKLVVALERTGRTAEAQAIVLDAMVSSYGGAAKASRDTFGGALAALQNQLDSLMTGSDGSLEGTRDAIEELTKTLSSKEVKAAFDSLLNALAKTIELTVRAGTEFTNFGTFVGNWAGRMLHGPDDVIERLDEQIALVQGRIAEINRAPIAFVSPQGTEELKAELAGLETHLVSLQAQRAQWVRDVNSTTATLPIVTVKGSPAGGAPALDTSKWKDGDPNVGPKPLAIEFADLFKDTDIEKARAFRIQLDALDELFFSGVIKVDKYDAAMRKLTGATSTGAGATSEFLAAQQRLAELIDAGPAAALERQRADMTLLAKAYSDGRFGIVGTAEAMSAYGEIVNHTLGNIAPEAIAKLDEMSVFAEQAGRNIQDALGTTLVRTLKGDFDSIGELWGDLLLNMAAQAMAVQLNHYLFGEFDKKSGSWSGALGPLMKGFMGLFGDGGTLGAGQWGIAGERGPEIVRGPAQIIPMSQLAGRASGAPTIVNNFHYSIAPGVSRGELMQAMQIAEQQAVSRIYEATRRAGAFAQ